VYLPRGCPSFLLLICASPLLDFYHQLWSTFFGGKLSGHVGKALFRSLGMPLE
jgi:hypothetical protein